MNESRKSYTEAGGRSRRTGRRHDRREQEDQPPSIRPRSTPTPTVFTGHVKIPRRTAAAHLKIEALPSKLIITLDGKQVQEGMKLYVAHDPTELTEYEVISDVAFLDPHTKEWQIIVIGPTLPAMSQSVKNFTTNPEDWAGLWQKRHPRCTMEIEEDV